MAESRTASLSYLQRFLLSGFFRFIALDAGALARRRAEQEATRWVAGAHKPFGDLPWRLSCLVSVLRSFIAKSELSCLVAEFRVDVGAFWGCGDDNACVRS